MSESAGSSVLIDALGRLSTTTIYEALGQKGDLDPSIGALWPGSRLYGPAFTVESQPADNLMIHHALAVAPAGKVLVVATGGSSDRGCWGLITTRAAQARGLAGLVIDGCVRDSAAIEERGFPVFCRGRAIRGTSKVGVGRIEVPITVGGQTVSPGDVVVGDRDGVVVVPQALIRKLLEDASARDRKEAHILQEIDLGALTVDLLGLRETLERAGLR